MLIETYGLEVFTPPCDPGAEGFSAVARLTTDIRGVLPYLNGSLRGAIYNPVAPGLTWKKGGHNLAFHPYEIAVSNVPDRDAAKEEVEGLVKMVNRTSEHRAEIEPSESAPPAGDDGGVQAVAAHQLQGLRRGILFRLCQQADRRPGAIAGRPGAE